MKWSLREKVAFVAVQVAACVASGLLFGWKHAWYGALAIWFFWAVAAVVEAAVRARREKRADQDL